MQEKIIERMIFTFKKLWPDWGQIRGAFYGIRTDIPFIQQIPKHILLDDAYINFALRKKFMEKHPGKTFTIPHFDEGFVYHSIWGVRTMEVLIYHFVEGTARDLLRRLRRQAFGHRQISKELDMPFVSFKVDKTKWKNLKITDIPYLFMGIPFLLAKMYYEKICSMEKLHQSGGWPILKSTLRKE